MTERRTQRDRGISWRPLALAVAFVGVGIALGRFFKLPEHTAPGVVRRDGIVEEQRLAALEQKLQSLQAADARRLIPQSDKPPARAKDAREEPANAIDSPPEPRTEAEINRNQQVARRQYLDGLSDKLDTEPFDPTWRVETERVITELVPARFGADITADQVTCASTLCRVRLNHPHSASLPADKLSDFLMNRGALGSMEIQADTDEHGSTTLYLLRGQPR
jgi:hypothetical protein